jgi:site-specific DNA-cytosine methylase
MAFIIEKFESLFGMTKEELVKAQEDFGVPRVENGVETFSWEKNSGPKTDDAMAFETLELFAGIGGNSYGLRGWASPVQFVEICENAQKALRANHPDVPIHDDVTTFEPTRTCDLITAGWPCTGFSTAGSKTGFAHAASGLFTEVVRIVRLAKPNLVFLENSHVVSKPEHVAVVAKAFDELGYDLRSIDFRAFAVGALHGRHRWFGLAIRRGFMGPALENDVEPFAWKNSDGTTTDSEIPRQIPQNTRENKNAIELLGNSVVPDQVRLAFFKLYAASNEWTIPERFEFSETFPEKGLKRKSFPFPLHIEVEITDESEPPTDRSRRSLPPLRGKYVVRAWATPTRSDGRNAGNSRISKRTVHHLSFLAHIAGPNDSVRRALSANWVKWLMGYPEIYKLL